MKKAMTRRFAGVLALSMTLTTAAFADPVGSFPNAELTLSRWAGDPWTAAQVKAADRWSAATGAKLTIDAIPYENLHDKQQLEMANGTYDIMYVHPGWFGEYAAAGALLPIDSYLSDSSKNRPASQPPLTCPPSFRRAPMAASNIVCRISFRPSLSRIARICSKRPAWSRPQRSTTCSPPPRR